MVMLNPDWNSNVSVVNPWIATAVSCTVPGASGACRTEEEEVAPPLAQRLDSRR
jgi:hypothetical protein